MIQYSGSNVDLGKRSGNVVYSTRKEMLATIKSPDKSLKTTDSTELTYESDSLRSRLRQFLLQIIERETESLVRLQARAAGYGWLDSFMRLAGIVGTHTFYLVMLPFLRWISIGSTVETVAPHRAVQWSSAYSTGFAPLDAVEVIGPTTVVMDTLYLYGRDLIVLLGFGCYFSGFLKDYLCLPRPLSPPVKRLSKVEEGAPLEFGFPSTHTTNCFITSFWSIYFLHGVMHLNTWPWVVLSALALLYASVVSYSRVHCGLHSKTDVVGGVLVALALVSGWLYLREVVCIWSLYLPYVSSTALSAVFLLIALHPNPIAACPCFDDSVAFLGVVAGLVTANQYGINSAPTFNGAALYSTYSGSRFFILKTAVRLTLGVSTLLLWRRLVKAFAKVLLGLPKHGEHGKGVCVEHRDSLKPCKEPVDSNNFAVDLNSQLLHRTSEPCSNYKLDKFGPATLTKVIVYYGIGFLAIGGVPQLFVYLGL